MCKHLWLTVNIACDFSAHRITLQACPLYVAEISPREIRGILVGMVNAVGASGLVVRQPIVDIKSCLGYRLIN